MNSLRTKKFKFKLPTAFTILWLITLFLIIISWIPNTTGKTTSSGKIESNPAGIFDLFLAPIMGFKDKIDVIIFILVLGGFLNILITSKALDAAIGCLVLKMKGKEIWIIVILISLFSIGGTTFGMGEETIAFYPVVIPILLAAGFDVITGLMTILFGAGLGVIGSILNPFVIQIAIENAQVANLGPTTGIIWRLVAWFVLTAIGIIFVVWYALRVQKNPEKSPLFAQKEFYESEFAIVKEVANYTDKRKAIMVVFITTFILMIFSLISWHHFGVSFFDKLTKTVSQYSPYVANFFPALGRWTFVEITALFFIASIIIALIDWKGEENYINNFIRGAADMLSVCLIIAFASGINFIISKTGMQTKLIKGLSAPMGLLGKTWFIIIVFLFFLCISVVIPSSSGFATAVFPVLGPVANAITVGLTSGTITAFSFANGIINLIAPTSAILMASLAISKVSYDRFIKVSWPLIVIIVFTAMILLIIGSLLAISNTKPWF